MKTHISAHQWEHVTWGQLCPEHKVLGAPTCLLCILLFEPQCTLHSRVCEAEGLQGAQEGMLTRCRVTKASDTHSR